MSSATAGDSPVVAEFDVTTEVCTTPTTIGSIQVSGPTDVCKDQTYTYTANYFGDATNVTYQWDTTDSQSSISDPTNYSTQVTWRTEGSKSIRCTFTDDNATDSPKTGSRNVQVKDCSKPTLDNGEVTGEKFPRVDEWEEYTATWTGNATDVTYLWSSEDPNVEFSAPNSKTTQVKFKTKDLQWIACNIVSQSAAVTMTPDIDVKPIDCDSSQGDIGTVTIDGPAILCKINQTKFTANNSGVMTPDQLTYKWSAKNQNGSTNSNVTFSTPVGNSVVVRTYRDGEYVKIVCEVSNPSANDTPQTGQKIYTPLQNQDCKNECSNTSCPSGYYCLDGVCIELGGPCDGVVCPDGEMCVNGTCEPIANIGNAQINGPTDVCFDKQAGPYTAVFDGPADPANCTYKWEFASGTDPTTAPNSATTYIQIDKGGNVAYSNIKCTITSPTSIPDEVDTPTIKVSATDCPDDPAGADEFHFYEPNTFFTSRQDTAITTRDTQELNDYEKGIGRSTPIKRTLDRKPYL